MQDDRDEVDLIRRDLPIGPVVEVEGAAGFGAPGKSRKYVLGPADPITFGASGSKKASTTMSTGLHSRNDPTSVMSRAYDIRWMRNSALAVLTGDIG